MKLGAMLVTAAVMTTGCATGQPSATPAPDLTVSHGCGYGFWVGDESQNARLMLEYADYDGASSGDVLETSQLTDPVWRAELDFGRDLFANWCDDVVEPGEPTPVVNELWRVSGSIDITMLPPAGECGPASANLTGAVARNADGEEIPLGDIELANESWGCFAG